MRRTDYEMAERSEMERLLATAEHGYLGMVSPDGWPMAVPRLRIGDDDTILEFTQGRGHAQAPSSPPRRRLRVSA